jgi:copper(I)-binding protein
MTEEAFAVIRSRSGKTTTRRLLIGIGATALLVLATAGCEAGLNAPTLEFHQASNGTHASFNGITISNMFVLAGPSGTTVPTGGSAGLFVGLFNSGENGDALVGASSSEATSVKLTRGTVILPAGLPANLTGPAPEVILTGLKTPLHGGSTVTVTLDFQRAGAITLAVPVEPQSFSYATFSAPPAVPAATATATGTATPTP